MNPWIAIFGIFGLLVLAGWIVMRGIVKDAQAYDIPN
jgi:hypothetical protein